MFCVSHCLLHNSFFIGITVKVELVSVLQKADRAAAVQSWPQGSLSHTTMGCDELNMKV